MGGHRPSKITCQLLTLLACPSVQPAEQHRERELNQCRCARAALQPPGGHSASCGSPHHTAPAGAVCKVSSAWERVLHKTPVGSQIPPAGVQACCFGGGGGGCFLEPAPLAPLSSAYPPGQGWTHVLSSRLQPQCPHNRLQRTSHTSSPGFSWETVPDLPLRVPVTPHALAARPLVSQAGPRVSYLGSYFEPRTSASLDRRLSQLLGSNARSLSASLSLPSASKGPSCPQPKVFLWGLTLGLGWLGESRAGGCVGGGRPQLSPPHARP